MFLQKKLLPYNTATLEVSGVGCPSYSPTHVIIDGTVDTSEEDPAARFPYEEAEINNATSGDGGEL